MSTRLGNEWDVFLKMKSVNDGKKGRRWALGTLVRSPRLGGWTSREATDKMLFTTRRKLRGMMVLAKVP